VGARRVVREAASAYADKQRRRAESCAA